MDIEDDYLTNYIEGDTRLVRQSSDCGINNEAIMDMDMDTESNDVIE